MSRKKLRRTRQRMTLEQAYSAIRETMPEAAEVVQQHARSTQKALDLIGRIMSASDKNGMTLEQAYSAIRETMPEAAEVVQQRAQINQEAIYQAGQIMSASDKNGMTLKQARSTIRETMPEAVKVVLEHTQRVQKILGLIDGIMKYVRAINETIKRRLAPSRKTHSVKQCQRMTLEQAYSAIRETMPEAAEVVQQHARSTQKALDLIGRIMSASDKNGMTLEQAYSAIRETMPEAAEVVQQRAQINQEAIYQAGQIMSASDKNGMTLKQARSTIRETMPEAAEVMQQHAQSTQKAIDLIGRIMSARDNMNGECTRHFNDFGKLLKNDYLEFAHNDTYPEEAEAYDALERIHSHMNQMRLAPRLASRNICTVAGSFSSGKSSFLNSLIGDKILPTKITPTTSIPTFVTHVDENNLEINAFNSGGGKTPINTSTFQQMTYEFEKDYGIPLKQIVERVVINTPHLGRCKRVAFIDTPGYTNPDDVQGDEKDRKIALQEVLTNPFLIWVVDCERGTLPQEDVDFLCEFRDQRKLSQLSSYQKSQRPIFIVLNKADKKLTEKRKILSEVKNVADKNKFPYFGIGLYSSHDKKWYGHSRQSFDDFLGTMDRAKTGIKLNKEIEKLFDDYARYHEDSYKNMKRANGLMIRIGMIIDEDPAHRRLNSDVNKYKQDIEEEMNEHKEHAAQSRSLKLKFGKCTQAFMDEINTMQNA